MVRVQRVNTCGGTGLGRRTDVPGEREARRGWPGSEMAVVDRRLERSATPDSASSAATLAYSARQTHALLSPVKVRTHGAGAQGARRRRAPGQRPAFPTTRPPTCTQTQCCVHNPRLKYTSLARVLTSAKHALAHAPRPCPVQSGLLPPRRRFPVCTAVPLSRRVVLRTQTTHDRRRYAPPRLALRGLSEPPVQCSPARRASKVRAARVTDTIH
jgi:hypothetical protein